MNLKKYAKLALFLTVCAFAPIKGMQSRRLEAYAQFLADAKHMQNQELFAQHIDEHEYVDALALFKAVPAQYARDYLSVIKNRLTYLSCDRCANGFVEKIIAQFPAYGVDLLKAASEIEDEEARASVTFMFASAYSTMNFASKAAFHKNLALYIYPIESSHTFFVAACMNKDGYQKLSCELIYENKKVGFIEFGLSTKDYSSHIDHLHVSDKSARGKGCGTLLLDFALKSLKDLGAKHVRLYASAHDSNGKYTASELQEKLLSFYARHGFWSENGSGTLVQDLSKNISSAPKAKL